MILVVSRHGHEIQRLALEPGRVYWIGRQAGCDITITDEKGVSRKHLRIAEEAGQWSVEVQSRYGGLMSAGEGVERADLHPGMQFTLGTYLFEVLQEASLTAPKPNVPILDDGGKTDEVSEQSYDEEATIVAAPGSLVPYLLVRTSASAAEEIFRLDGEVWAVGRDAACEVAINHPNVSRRHFEIRRKGLQFFIKDNGSSNGIILNGIRLDDGLHSLASGDVIQIRSVSIRFELRDFRFEKMLATLPNLPTLHSPLASPLASSAPVNSDVPAVVRIDPSELTALSGLKERILKLWLERRPMVLLGGALIFVLLLIVLSPGEKDEKAGRKELASNTLTDEQQREVRNLLEVARNHLLSERWMACVETIDRLNQIVPGFQDSQQIRATCDTKWVLVKTQMEQARIMKENAKIESLIQETVAKCRSEFDSHRIESVDELTACLSPALNHNPGHSQVVALQEDFTKRESDAAEKARRQQGRASRARRGIAQFNRAQQALDEGQLRDAIREFETYLDDTYPDQGDRVEMARKRLAEAKIQFGESVKEDLETCKRQFGENQFKIAYESCKKVIARHPENKEARELMAQSRRNLSRELQNIFQEALFEENLGQVNAAIQKWKQIVKDDLPGNEYYQKAKLKLKSYEAGL